MFRAAIVCALVAGSNAFAPQQGVSRSAPALKAAEVESTETEDYWDPMGLYKLGHGSKEDRPFDTFEYMFPDCQFLEAAEIKHGRQAMLAWTGVWATSTDPLGLGLHFPGFPEEADWTKALGVFQAEQPGMFGAILLFIAIAEGESVGWGGDNYRGMSNKKDQGDLNWDPLGIKLKVSPEKYARFKDVEMKNGRAAMIAMASLFSMKAIEGSVPIMDILGHS